MAGFVIAGCITKKCDSQKEGENISLFFLSTLTSGAHSLYSYVNTISGGTHSMFEKVNPAHPDKVADRIAGAMLDIAYANQKDPRVAIEVLIGHGECTTIAESSYSFTKKEVKKIVERIAGKQKHINLKVVPQDIHLAKNQEYGLHCGDNGIFRGSPVTHEQNELTAIAKKLYSIYGTDGKYLLDGNKLIVCQSYAKPTDSIMVELQRRYDLVLNPLGYWTGGLDCDSGLTGRKLGSDMGDSVTGGCPTNKDLSKADVSVNIYAWLKAQETCDVVEMSCAIGDTEVNGIPFSEIVETAKNYIKSIGGFEKFAEWGLIR